LEGSHWGEKLTGPQGEERLRECDRKIKEREGGVKRRREGIHLGKRKARR